MDKLHRLFAPALVGTFLSLTGCTGINPFNWTSIDTPCCDQSGCGGYDEEHIVEGEYAGGPLMQRRSHGMLSRGILREHWNLARGFEESGDTEQAAAHYEQILAMEPDYAPAHHRLGVLSTMWGRFREADDHFRLARRPANPATATEETYIEENVISEREAEAKMKREIAAERGEVASEQGETQQAAVVKPARRRFQIGARISDAYYAQQERRSARSVVVPPEQALPQERVAVRNRTSQTVSSTAASRSAKLQSAGQASTTKSYNKAARTQSRQAVTETLAETEEQIEEVAEIEEPVAKPTTSSNASPQATIRPTASSVRPASSAAPLSRSAQLRENTLRPEKQEIPSDAHESLLAEEDSITTEVNESVAVSSSTGTSGVRRISNQEPDAFESEQLEYAQTVERLSNVREREKKARAEMLEAEVEHRVAQELEVALAERRLKLAQAQLRLAQQQFDSARESSGIAPVMEEHAQPATAIESLDEAESLPSSDDSQHPLPAPRRLKVDRTSAVESQENDFLATMTDEPTTAATEGGVAADELPAELSEIANVIDASEAARAEQAGANLPAEAAALESAKISEAANVEEEAEPAVLLVSHAEEVLPTTVVEAVETEVQETELQQAEVQQTMPLEGEENLKIRQRQNLKRAQQLMPDARANQQELPVRSLDEQTLNRLEVTPRTTFAKKAPAMPPTMLYR